MREEEELNVKDDMGSENQPFNRSFLEINIEFLLACERKSENVKERDVSVEGEDGGVDKLEDDLEVGGYMGE